MPYLRSWALVSIYLMEYYSAIKKNKLLPFAATWVKLDKIILNGDFPSSPVAKTLCLQCREPGFDPWSGN